MKRNNYFYVSLLGLCLNLIPAFIPLAQSQTNSSTDYESLQGILPVITNYKKNPQLYLLPKPIATSPAPAIPNPTAPIPIYSTPSAPGKYPLVRWLLPGGPPPAAPYLPPLTCTFETCPIN